MVCCIIGPQTPKLHMRWLRSITRIIDWRQLIGTHSLAAFLQLELFRVYLDNRFSCGQNVIIVITPRWCKAQGLQITQFDIIGVSPNSIGNSQQGLSISLKTDPFTVYVNFIYMLT